jgi:mono/diheme cytochrome c family protein
VVQRSCACAGCHAGRDAWLGLDLTPAVAYDNLVGRPSQEVPGLLLVKPFDVDRSYLVQKLLGLQARGARMPLKADPLDADEIGRIIRWIQAGAPRSEGEP